MSDRSGLLRSVISFLIDHANRLDRWALESRKGGWSTHQVAANQEAANECRQITEKLRAALSSPDDTAERLAAFDDMLAALTEAEPHLTDFANDVAGDPEHDPSVAAALELLRRKVRAALAKSERGR